MCICYFFSHAPAKHCTYDQWFMPISHLTAAVGEKNLHMLSQGVAQPHVTP